MAQKLCRKKLCTLYNKAVVLLESHTVHPHSSLCSHARNDTICDSEALVHDERELPDASLPQQLADGPGTIKPCHLVHRTRAVCNSAFI